MTDTPEIENIVDFINENEISMHVLLAHQNPYRSKEKQNGLVHWSCQILNEKKQYIVIYFSKGAGIRRWSQLQTGIRDTIPIHVPHDKIGKPYDGPMPPFENDQDQKTFNLCSQVEPPFLIEVLDVLAKDIWLIEQTGSFDNWAKAMKISSDSRFARAAYDIICNQRAELSALLGEGEFHRLLYEIDRIQPAEIVQTNQAE